MLWLKGCPKCKGDLSDNTDAFGYYVYCVQCGKQLNEAQIGKLLTYTLERRGQRAEEAVAPAVAVGKRPVAV